MRGKVRRKRDGRTVLFYVAVTILGIVFLAVTTQFLARLNGPYYTYSTPPHSLLYTLNRGDYVQAWREVQDNRAMGATEKTDQEYALPYAVVDYFEAASFYNVYLESGDKEKTEQYREAMDEAYEAMGELQFMAEEIDAMFQ